MFYFSESCSEFFHNWVSSDSKDETELNISDPESKRDEFEKDFVPYSDVNDFEPCVEDCNVDITSTGIYYYYRYLFIFIIYKSEICCKHRYIYIYGL